jgi:hypothetical protein
MLRKFGAFVILAAVSATTASAAGLPDIMVGPSNTVPQCVTPGRLMALLKLRNPGLSPRYDGIAMQYMRFGEELGVRWDIAFYQMIVETGALSYWRGNRRGDVRPEQNNFAGLGASGNGVHGESFKDVETGVRAHIEHVLLYAGHPVADPVAERTRKVREWRVLDSWQQSFRRPLTFADLANKWAPGNRHYASMVQAVAEQFQSGLCHAPDPQPEMVQQARALIRAGAGKLAEAGREGGAAKVAEMAPPGHMSGEELAKRAIEQGKAEGNDKRSGLGVQPLSRSAAAPSVPYKVGNVPASGADAAGVASGKSPAAKTGSADKSSGSRIVLAGAATAAVAGAAKASTMVDTAVPPAANQRCRVWTASYGGQKALIIRSVADQVVNFTVLDVNDGSAAREAEAFIAAYARNGKIAGEYTSQAQALDKAFELCPEG